MQKVKCRIKKDDKVKVIAGKDRGKIGKVIRVDRRKHRIMVENINMVKRHLRPGTASRQGGIVEGEAPIHWSNVMLLCNKCVKPTRVGIRFLEDGQKVRYCKKCNEIIDA